MLDHQAPWWWLLLSCAEAEGRTRRQNEREDKSAECASAGGRRRKKGSVSLKGGKRGKHADAEIAVGGEVDVHEGKRGLGRFRTVSVISILP